MQESHGKGCPNAERDFSFVGDHFRPNKNVKLEALKVRVIKVATAGGLVGNDGKAFCKLLSRVVLWQIWQTWIGLTT